MKSLLIHNQFATYGAECVAVGPGLYIYNDCIYDKSGLVFDPNGYQRALPKKEYDRGYCTSSKEWSKFPNLWIPLR